MAELTPEQKQAMITAAEARRAQAQADVNAAAAPVPEPEKILPAEPTNVPTYNPQTQGVQEWGPYDDYVIVTTNYGQYGVPKGQVLHFEVGKEFSRREGVWKIVHLPRYRDANQEEKEYAKQASRQQEAAEANIAAAQSWGEDEFGSEEGRIEAVQR